MGREKSYSHKMRFSALLSRFFFGKLGLPNVADCINGRGVVGILRIKSLHDEHCLNGVRKVFNVVPCLLKSLR